MGASVKIIKVCFVNIPRIIKSRDKYMYLSCLVFEYLSRKKIVPATKDIRGKSNTKMRERPKIIGKKE
jgi:hypothetical protein